MGGSLTNAPCVPVASFHRSAGIAVGHVGGAEAAPWWEVACIVLAGLAPCYQSRRGSGPGTAPRKQAWSGELAQLGRKESAESTQRSCSPPSNLRAYGGSSSPGKEAIAFADKISQRRKSLWTTFLLVGWANSRSTSWSETTRGQTWG